MTTMHRIVPKKKSCSRLALFPVSVVLTALMFTPASAIESEPTAVGTATSEDQFMGLEEVIVTARKRSESIHDIPDTIQVLSSDVLERADVRSINDIQYLVSNFQVVEAQQPGVVLVNIRGIGQTRNGEAPIALVIDGVQQHSPNQITQDLFDIERIEVLKGPQGALYGRNAIGGAINITTRAPGEELGGSFEIGYAEGDEFRLRGSVSGPLAENIGFRVSGSFKDRDGQIENVTLDENVDYDEVKALRGALVFTPSDALSIDLRGSYYDQEAGAAWYRSGDVNAPHGSKGPVVANILGLGTRELSDLSARFNYDMNGMTLTAVSAYSSVESLIDEDLDYEALDLIAARQTLDVSAFSQEVRLASSRAEERLSWMIGAYYLHTDRDLDTFLFLQPDLTGLSFPIPLPAALSTDDNDAYALFGQAIYRLTDAWQLTTALRYDIDDRQQTDRNPPTPLSPSVFEKKFTSLQPKVSLSYTFPDRSLAYATVAKGFRAGGFNANDVVTRQYDQEEVWSYETGFKAILADNLLNLNGAVYYMDITGRQVYGLDLSTGPAQFIANPIPKSHVIGAELELLARPTEWLDITLGGGLQTSKIDEYDLSVFANTGANGDYTGNDLNQMPGYTINGALQYTQPIGEASLIGRIDMSGSGGDYYWEIDNAHKREAIWKIDLRLTYERGPFALTGFVRNVFDKRYDLEFVPFEFSGLVTGLDLGSASPPRQFGVIAKFSY